MRQYGPYSIRGHIGCNLCLRRRLISSLLFLQYKGLCAEPIIFEWLWEYPSFIFYHRHPAKMILGVVQVQVIKHILLLSHIKRQNQIGCVQIWYSPQEHYMIWKLNLKLYELMAFFINEFAIHVTHCYLSLLSDTTPQITTAMYKYYATVQILKGFVSALCVSLLYCYYMHGYSSHCFNTKCYAILNHKTWTSNLLY